MEKSMDNAERKIKYFREKMSLVAVHGEDYLTNPTTYSFTRDRVRCNGYPSDGKSLPFNENANGNVVKQ